MSSLSIVEMDKVIKVAGMVKDNPEKFNQILEGVIKTQNAKLCFDFFKRFPYKHKMNELASVIAKYGDRYMAKEVIIKDGVDRVQFYTTGLQKGNVEVLHCLLNNEYGKSGNEIFKCLEAENLAWVAGNSKDKDLILTTINVIKVRNMEIEPQAIDRLFEKLVRMRDSDYVISAAQCWGSNIVAEDYICRYCDAESIQKYFRSVPNANKKRFALASMRLSDAGISAYLIDNCNDLSAAEVTQVAIATQRPGFCINLATRTDKIDKQMLYEYILSTEQEELIHKFKADILNDPEVMLETVYPKELIDILERTDFPECHKFKNMSSATLLRKLYESANYSAYIALANYCASIGEIGCANNLQLIGAFIKADFGCDGLEDLSPLYKVMPLEYFEDINHKLATVSIGEAFKFAYANKDRLKDYHIQRLSVISRGGRADARVRFIEEFECVNKEEVCLVALQAKDYASLYYLYDAMDKQTFKDAIVVAHIEGFKDLSRALSLADEHQADRVKIVKKIIETVEAHPDYRHSERPWQDIKSYIYRRFNHMELDQFMDTYVRKAKSEEEQFEEVIDLLK